VGETTLRGTFGECVNAELSVLKIRLHRKGAELVYISIMFALIDALASKECDMLLPVHAHKESHVSSGNIIPLDPQYSAFPAIMNFIQSSRNVKRNKMTFDIRAKLNTI